MDIESNESKRRDRTLISWFSYVQLITRRGTWTLAYLLFRSVIHGREQFWVIRFDINLNLDLNEDIFYKNKLIRFPLMWRQVLNSSEISICEQLFFFFFINFKIPVSKGKLKIVSLRFVLLWRKIILQS